MSKMKDMCLPLYGRLAPTQSSGGITPTGTKEITIEENGLFTEDVTNFAEAKITVNVSTGSSGDDLLDSVVSGQGNIDVLSVGSSKIRPYAFHGTTNIGRLVADNAESVGDDAFSGATSITEISLSNATYLGKYAIQGSGVTSFYAPKAKELDKGCFSHARLINTLSLPSVEICNSFAFSDCSNLRELYLPKCATMRATVIIECPKLRVLVLGAVNIAKNTIAAASGDVLLLTLLKVDPPSSIYMPSITRGSVVMANIKSVPILEGFRDNFRDGTANIYVPDNLVDEFKVASNWSLFSDRIKPVSEYVE